MSTESAHPSYLLRSSTRETRPSMNFSPLSISSFCDSQSRAKHFFDSNVMFAKVTPSNDVLATASVVRKALRTFGLPRIELQTFGRDFLEKDKVRRF